MICQYGCSNIANYQFKNGKWCCSKNVNSCIGKRSKDSENKKGKPSGRKGKTGSIAWNKVLKKDSDERIRRNSEQYSKKIKSGEIVPSFLNKKHSEETKSKISISMNGNRNANHRGDRQSFYKNIRMDSSWEVKTAHYLDNSNINWVYSEKGYKLSNGKIYYPDFFIYENNILLKLIEVKGFFREKNRIKFELFKKDYPNLIIELWDKNVLKSKKII